jgi:hypothetical protein
MAMNLRFLLATAALATVALCGATGALACGDNSGYSDGGFPGASSGYSHRPASRAYGISAIITPLDASDVLSGHVAAWVGVGGPGEGPRGTNEGLQIGYSGFPSITGSGIYYEVMQPGRFPMYHQVAAGVPNGTPAKVTVLEMRARPNWWRVWLDHKPVSRPIFLPRSHRRWTPLATTESWDGGTGGACNSFRYSFRHVSIAYAPGGGWQQILGATS